MNMNDLYEVGSRLLLNRFGQTDMRSLCTHRDTSKNAIVSGILNDERIVKNRNVLRNIAFFRSWSAEQASIGRERTNGD